MVMNTSQSHMLTATYMPPVTAIRPVYGRKYTLIQQKENEMLLFIGTRFYKEGLDPNKEQVILAEWVPKDGTFILFVSVSPHNGKKTEVENLYKLLNDGIHMILKMEQPFFSHFPWLYHSPVYVNTSIDDEQGDATFIGLLQHYLFPLKRTYRMQAILT